MNAWNGSRSAVGAVALACALAGLTGCGTLDDGEEAQYPHGGAPVGEEDELAGVSAAASLEANPPSSPGVAPAAGGEDVQVGVASDEYADTDPSALTDFKPVLAPYGTWQDDATYGTVWVPSPSVVGADFAPYVTAGHWVYDDDYVWVSDYEWGWAPFHYGRWVYVSGRGWAWIPGRVYRGAWVTWRMGYDGWDYVGWAPLPPTWYWYDGYAVGLYVVPPAPYVFCHHHDVFAPVVATHVVPAQRVPAVASHTRPYVAATPSVNGGSGRVAASPTVNDAAGGGAGGGAGGRVAAAPTVNGAGVGGAGGAGGAVASAGGAVNAATLNGPPPKDLGIEASQVPHAPRGNPGLARAQAMASPSSARAMGAAGPMGFAGDARGEAGVLVGGEGSHARLSEPRTIGGGESAGHVYGGRRPVRLPSYGGEPSGGSGGDYSSSGQTLPSYGGAGSSGMPLPGSGLVGSGSLSSPSGGMVGGGGGAPASHAYHSGHSGFSSPSYSSPSYSAPVQSFHGGSGGAHISGGGGYHSSSSAGHHVGGGGHHR